MTEEQIINKNIELVKQLKKRNGKILDAVEFMRRVLPSHYTCEPRTNGVHCHSPIGINENDPEHWEYVYLAIKQKFGEDFMEVFHQTCTNHVKFTVFIRF